MIMQSGSMVDEQSVVRSWIALLRRRWLIGTAVFALVFGVAVVQLWRARPVYRVDAKLRIGEPPPTTGVGAGSILGFMRLGGDPFANDLELLNSRTVTEAVVRDAALTVSLVAPRGWYRDSIFESIRTTDSTIRARYGLNWVTTDQIEVRQLSPTERTVGRFKAGVPASFGGITVVFKQKRGDWPDDMALSVAPFGDAVRRASARVTVERRRRDANVAAIAVQDPDPALAHQIATSAIYRFTDLRARIAERESGQNVDSLRAVAQHTLKELRAAESDLEQLQRDALLVDPAAQTEAFVERFSAVSSQLETTRAELAAISAALQRASAVESAAERWTRLLAYPPFLSNVTIGELLNQLNALEQRRSALSNRRTEQNREYSEVLAQIAYIDRSLTALARDVQTALQEQLRRLEAQVSAMERSLAAVPRSSIELARRQRSARVLSEVMVLTEQRLRQEELRQALSFSNIQIIDPPALVYKPVWPRKKIGLIVGWLLALFTATLAIAVSEQADRRVRGARQASQLTGAPVLGVMVRSKAGVRMSALELRALVHHASANGRGPLRIVLAPVGDTDPKQLLDTINGAFPHSDGKVPEVSLAANIRDFASASAAAGDVPVALIVDTERVTRAEIAQAARLIVQAGGSIGGTILICGSDRAAQAVWA